MITKESWLKSILAGLFIGIGGIAYLSVENKVVGAALFAVGLFTICTLGYNLYTGKLCYILDSDKKRKLPCLVNTDLGWQSNWNSDCRLWNAINQKWSRSGRKSADIV